MELGVFRDALLEKVRLAFERDQFHEVERIDRKKVFFLTEREEEAIRDELYVRRHVLGFHPEKTNRKSL